jgi:thiosulfate dehydrogenase
MTKMDRPRPPRGMKIAVALAVVVAAMTAGQPAAAADESGVDGGRDWSLAYGGRLYDSWYETLGEEGPRASHPAYPSAGPLSGPDTWRCVSCHGWDYGGSGDPAVAGKSLLGLAGTEPRAIAAMIRRAPHGFTAQQIPDDALATLAAFISEGTHDRATFLDDRGMSTGDAERGRAAYEGICASCHQIDGMAFISAEEGDRPSLGWVSRHKPAQALHKIRNGQPGADMVAIRFMDDRAVADLMAYIQTLDPGAD